MREHLVGERVLVHKVNDGLGVAQYFFRWDDPRVAMGPAGSPPSNNNGTYNSFFKDASSTLGIDRGFDPATGVYNHARLIAIAAVAAAGEVASLLAC